MVTGSVHGARALETAAVRHLMTSLQPEADWAVDVSGKLTALDASCAAASLRKSTHFEQGTYEAVFRYFPRSAT